MYTYCSNGTHWYWFWPIGFFVFLCIVVGLSRALWWRGNGHKYGYYNGSGNHHDALEILKGRYASGAIDKEAYERIKRDLEK